MNPPSLTAFDLAGKNGQEVARFNNSTKAASSVSRLFRVEPMVRFELTTYSLRVNCSTPELHRRLRVFNGVENISFQSAVNECNTGQKNDGANIFS